MNELLIIVLVGAVVFSTFTIEGIAGFGSTIMALPFVIMLLGLDKAVPLLSALNLLLALFLISRSWRNIVLKEYLFIVANVAVGVVAGLFLMDHMSKRIMIAILAAFTLFVGGRGLYLTLRKKSVAVENKVQKKNIFSCLTLLTGGIFQGAFSSGGPLVVMYATRALPEKVKFRATLSLLWFTTHVIMNIKWFAAGNVWNRELFIQFLCALPFVAGGMVFGDHLHWKVDQKKFTLLVYSLLIIVAFILIAKSIFE